MSALRTDYLHTIYASLRGAKRTIIILSLALAGCRGQVAPASPTPDTGSLDLLTDSATAPLLRDLVSSYRAPNVLISWKIEKSEAGTVIDWLKTSESPYALTSYLPAQSGFEDGSLWSTPVGQDGIAVIVHPSNPIADLTPAQLRSIFQGRIGNWQELGGADIPLHVIAHNENSSASALIQSMVLGERRITRSAQLAPTDDAMIELVSADPGAIGYVSMGYLDDRIRAVPLEGILPTPETVTANQYPLRTPIVFVGEKEPGNDLYRAFFAWVQSPAGQAIVMQRYGGLAK